MIMSCHDLGGEGCMGLIQCCLGCCMGLILKYLQGVYLIRACLGGCVRGLPEDVLWEYGVNPGMS